MRKFTCYLLIGMAAVASLPASGNRVALLSPQYALINMELAARNMSELQRADAVCAQTGLTGERALSLTKPRAHALRRAALYESMKAKKVQTYIWNGNGWTEEDLYDYTFDAQGRVTVELVEDAEGDFARTVSEYDDYGMVKRKETTVSFDGGENYQNNSKEEFEYDPILTDVITMKDERAWIAGDWRPGNCYKRFIKRDDKGNITNVTIAVLFNGIYDPTQRLTVTYGPDGTATELSEQILSFNYDTGEYYWEQGPKYTNLTWDRTDGQIYDIEDLFIGANRMKTGIYEDPEGISMDISVEYAEDNDGYVVTMTAEEDGLTMTATTAYTPLENDGYRAEMKTEMLGFTIIRITEEVRYDEWGLMTLQDQTVEGYGQGTGYDTVTGTVEYDAEGKPTVYTVTEEYSEVGEEQVYTDYIIRAEYSDYVDYAVGVTPAGVSDADSEKCFDLNGLRVAESEKGRIIIRNGNGKKSIKY